MELKLATKEDANTLWQMQIEAFATLLDRYEDYDTNPGNETVERVLLRIMQPVTYFYFIIVEGNTVGAIRIVDKGDGSRKKIAPLFIIPEYQNKGYAQQAIKEAEKLHGQDNWELDTILEEKGNCYLYEKMGYHRNGQTRKINDKMTLVFYEKD